MQPAVAESQGVKNDDVPANPKEGDFDQERRARENIIIPGLLQTFTMNEYVQVSQTNQRQIKFVQVGEELLSLWKIGWPIIATSILNHSRSLISMLFLGHLGKIELAGGSLALSFGNVTGHSVMKGLSMGMEPICCQAYGAKRLSVLSQTYQKTICLLFLATIPIALLWLNVEPIFKLLGQDQGITKIAKVFMLFSIPDLFAQAHLHPLRIFLRTQSLTMPNTVAAVCSSLLHLPITYFLVVYLKLGAKGVALATAWNSVNLNLLLILYVSISKTPLKPWGGATLPSAFQGWKPLLALSLPSAAAVCLEWWWYEIIMFLCGLLSNSQVGVATMGIVIQTTGLIYVFPYSLGLGLSTRIGQHLGSGEPARAQWTAIIGLAVAVVVGLMAFAFTVGVRSVWGKLYTTDGQILALTSSALPVLGLCEISNAPQTAACGVLTGSARPNIGARVNFCAFYLVGLPVAVVMAFKLKFGFLGLLFGLAAAQASCVGLMVYALVRTDWKHEAKRAEELSLATLDKAEVEANLVSPA
ncbi:protein DETOXIFICATION 53 [Malania oleifera]|uniref:protein DETOXIFICATION 53 n=1 Tax=Malania oleifera TaxID=397392 RepID=UPI0025AE208B|nr:protein DETOXIFICATION 53 [Malania oleifera]